MAELTAAVLKAEVIVSGVNKAKSDMDSLAQKTSQTQNILGKMWLGLGGLVAAGIAAAAGGMVAFGVESIKMAGDFQASMTRIVTSAGELPNNMKLISDGILKMAVDTATSTEQLASGMYYVESAGYRAKDALTVLRVAAMGAKSENADLATVSNALTTVMRDYGISANHASDAMNFLIGIVANGKTNLQDLASSMSQVLPAAAALHVHLLDVGAAMATLTMHGVPAANAATYLRQMIIALSAPAKAGEKALKAIGLSTQEVSDMMKKSLPDTLKMIMDHLAQTYKVGSPQYVAALKAIAGGSKQMQGMLGLTGSYFNDFQQNMKKVNGTMKDNKGTVAGWAEVQQNFNFKMDRAKEVVQTLGIKIGTALLPVAGNLADLVSTHLVPAFDTAVTVGKNVVDWTIKWHEPLLAVAGALTLFFIPAVIKSGVESVIAGGKVAFSFVANLVKSGAEAWTAMGKIALWIGKVILSGVQAAAAGAKILATWIATVIRSGVEAIIAGAKITASFIATLAKAAWQAGVTAVAFLVDLIPAIIGVVTESLVAAATAIPGLIVGFVGWAISAGAAAVATIAATWPILAIIAAILILIGIIVLIATHWQQIWDFVKKIWQDMQAAWDLTWKAISTTVTNIWNGIIGFIKAGINDVIDVINGFIRQLDKIQIDTPFGHVGINIPLIPHLAKGGNITGEGWAVVGERGPELMRMSQGAQVRPLTGRERSGGGGEQHLHIHTQYANEGLLAQDMGRIMRQRDLMERVHAA